MKGLVLLGGYSTRMKQDKGLLKWQGGVLFQRGMDMLSKVCDEGVYISIRKSQMDSVSPWLKDKQCVIYDREPFTDIGPASGILSAHAQFPSSDLFIFACDFPLCEDEAFQQLKVSFPGMPFVTFVHEDGNPEPVFGIWSAHALDKLQSSVLTKKKTGPCYTLKELIKDGAANANETLISPIKEEWLFNANTMEDWTKVVKKSK